MSYILDALRKADAERERGHVPGIHAQPVFTGAAPIAARRGAFPWGWSAAGALLLVVLGGLVWMVLGGARNGAGAPLAATAPAAAVPAPAPTPSAAVPPAVPVAVAPAIVTAPPTPTPVPAVRKPAVAPPRTEAPRAAAPSGGDSPATGKVPAAAPPTAPSAAAPPRVYAINELPDEVRRQLPAVTVGGSVYSATPANRILIVNGLVLHEGEQAAPELVLRQIKLKGAVLEFRGYRYEIAY